jgi:uncharacterized protein (TIGR02453 family)
VSFDGFPDEGLVFYEGLEADNTKTYWTRHKASYDSHVRAPLQAMLDELAAEFGVAKVFRPYRDVRFSHDKTPYKTHQGAVITPEGRGAGSLYVQISADGLRVAGGCWRLETDQVARFRRAVADPVHGPRLEQEVSRLSRTGFEIAGERLTRVPAGYSVDDDRVELLKHKALHAARTWEPAEWLHTRRALEEVRSAWREMTTLNTWLSDNVGATSKEPRRR